MSPNLYLIAGGTIVIGLGVFHSLLGEIYLVRRLLRRADLPRLFGDESFTRLTIRYAWHLLTLFCVGSSAILYIASTQDARTFAPIVWVLSGTFALSGVWALVSTKGRHLSWIALFLASVLAGIGAT